MFELPYAKGLAFRLLPTWAGLPIGATDTQGLANATPQVPTRCAWGVPKRGLGEMRRPVLLRHIR
jgi:hypothetical protein